MFYNKEIEQYRRQLISLTNNSGLSVGAAYYVLKDVYRDMESLYYKSIQEELKIKPEDEHEEEVIFVPPVSEGEVKEAMENNDEQNND